VADIDDREYDIACAVLRPAAVAAYHALGYEDAGESIGAATIALSDPALEGCLPHHSIVMSEEPLSNPHHGGMGR